MHNIMCLLTRLYGSNKETMNAIEKCLILLIAATLLVSLVVIVLSITSVIMLQARLVQKSKKQIYQCM